MNWVKLAILILDLAGRAVRWIEANKIASDAQRRLIERAREAIDANADKARIARERVRADLSNPDRLRDDASGPWRDD